MKKKFTMLLTLLLACVGVMKAEVNSELLSKTITVGENATGLTIGQWYILNNHNRGNCVSEETTALKMRAIPANGVEAEDVAGMLFKLIDAGEGYYNIVSGNGLYFNLGDNSAAVSEEAIAYEIALINAESPGHYYIKEVGEGWIADGQGTGQDFVGYKKDVPTTIGGNNCYHFKPVTLTDAQYVDVTYKYMLGGQLKKEVTVEDALVGSAYNAPAIAYVTFSYPDGNITAGTSEVEVTCTENLPFIASESFETAKWYIVDMHSNNSGNGFEEIANGTKKQVWTYAADRTDKGCIILPQEYSKQASLFGDEKLWCFVGNVFDGFKIYNKAAGSGVTLNKKENSNSLAGMSDANSATLYTLATSSQITGAHCFLPKGHSYYLNTQGNESGTKFMQGWNQPDGGSSCRFFAPTYFVEDLLAVYAGSFPGAVGSAEDVTAEQIAIVDAAYAAVRADGWNTAAVTAEVSGILETLKSSSIIEFTPNAYYFIKGTGAGNNASWYITYDGSNCKAMALAGNEKLGAKHVWKFETIEGEDGYKLNSCNLNKYLSLAAAPATSSINSDYASGNKFLLTDNGVGKFTIKNGNNNIMRTKNLGEINHWMWGSTNMEANETWYLVPVTELEITISEFASICLPFDVVPGEGVKAYAIEGTNATQAILVEKEDIPAGEGAILEGNGTVKLNLTGAASNWEDNLLEGTTVNTNIDKAAYVLAKPEGKEIGLYSAKLTDGSFLNNANKAYLPASAVSNTGAPMFSFSRGDDETTSIDNVKLINDNVVIYDLLGRRVEKMEKGIYIVNGKKVIR